jgi:hypothetical protein
LATGEIGRIVAAALKARERHPAMKSLRFLAVAILLSALSGCFTSKQDLVGNDAVADHAVITFLGEEDDAKPITFTRDGNGYVSRGDGQEIHLHLKPVADDFYVAQLSGPGNDGGMEYLFGYMRLDVASSLAEVWLMVGSEGDVRPGLSQCEDVICIDDLAAYVAYGQEKVASGEASDTTFKATVE